MLRPRTPADADVVYSPWRPNLWVIVPNAAALTGIVLGALLVLFPRVLVAIPLAEGRPFEEYRYSLVRWESQTILSNIFARLGIGPNPGGDDPEAVLQRYFELTSRILAQSESAEPDLETIELLSNERATYENDVERLVETYVDEAIASAGLREGLPLFSDVRITWPQVDFELTDPPRLLVRSPRDRILRAGDTLLKPDITLRQIEAIEADVDDEDTVSLVVSIGGLAAYPAIVRDDRSYTSMLDTSAHEWVHHYLAFYPLGKKWGSGGDSETLNETTANIAGRELANLVHAAHPVALEPGADGRAPRREITVDVGAELRKLRLEVDALLAEGKVEEAERVMEERREFLDDNGYPLRKINQAYFAFYGTYADSPASSNPVGPKIERVWELTQDVGVFLQLMREVEDVPELDALLADLEAAAGSPGEAAGEK
ncbi:MAG: hypothetical protein IT303_12760 [Dehalococcoidia bacterium]|nr:hypothetical protein [Dehalococcoidia bacterium]